MRIPAMARYLTPAVALVFLFTFPLKVAPHPVQETAPSVFRNVEEGNKLVTATSHFAWDLYKSLAESNKDDNLFFSPASIAFALGMTYLGARGQTAQQMADVLKFKDVHPDHVHSSFSDLIAHLNNPEANYTLHTVNRLYGQEGYNFQKAFLDDTKTHYEAGLEEVDYTTNYEDVLVLINKFVEEQTEQKIKDLLPSGSLDSFTRLVLINAIYFKGDWAKKFNVTETKQGQFHIDEENSVTMDMMFRKADFNFGISWELKCSVLELPYLGDQLSMVIILPHERTGLASLEKAISVEMLQNVDEQFRMSESEVIVTLPRFKLEQDFDLGSTLTGLGMKDLFNADAADLSGVDGGRTLSVTKVVHKAFIEVNEEGSEAAAATAVIFSVRSMPSTFVFTADHPFLFFIRDKRSGAILFLGRLAKPDGSPPAPGHDLSGN